ncbi:universal stress protein [Pedococcus bigeumensis]|uniref:universal stress protein n=1 Tax=Pedococcus bigeumensis TaxID=433644 RepID=UPI002FEAF240
MSSTTTGAVVVGVDGQLPAALALDWAIAEAQRTKAPLHLVNARMLPLRGPTVETGFAVHTAESDEILAAATDRAHTLAPGLHITRAAGYGNAAALLVEESRDASCLVVGARGRSPLGSLLLGSTSLDVAAHSRCPVVVVRDRPHQLPDGPGVVVGSDGSEVSEAAIAAGFEEADRLGVPLTVVHAWFLDSQGTGLAALETEDTRQVVAEEEDAVASEAVVGWSEKYPDVKVRQRVLRTHPVEALVDLSRQAELVVVGSRGRGGFSGLLLGSVSQGVLHHAHCPVMVVRSDGGA